MFCIFLGIVSLIFATTAADVLVEIGDLFVNFYNVLVLCIIECVAVGWSKEGKGLAEEINRYSGRLKMPRKAFGISLKFLCPAVLLALAAPQFIKLFAGLGYPAWAQFAFGWGAGIAVFISGFAMDLLSRPRPARLRKTRKIGIK